MLILALLIAIAAAGLTVGGWRLAPAPILNGPIVFGRFDPSVSDTVIHTIRPDGSDLHVAVAGPNECPQFSPDGRQLAVAMKVVDVDGTNVRSLPNQAGPATLGCSTWSPDGTRLAVEGFADNDPSANGIFLVNATDGSDVVQLTVNGQGGNDVPGDFSPDGSELSYIHTVAGSEVGKLLDRGPRHRRIPRGEFARAVAGDHVVARWAMDRRFEGRSLPGRPPEWRRPA